MRFESREDEEDFRKRMDKQAVVPLALLLVIAIPVGVTHGLGNYLQELGREDSPFEWSHDDPRTFYFCVGISLLALCVSFFVACALRLTFGWLSTCRFELLAAVACGSASATVPFISCWHIALLYSRAPDIVWMRDLVGADLNEIILKMVIVTTCCLYIPMRACILWVVPAAAILSTVFIAGFVRASATSFYLQAQVLMLFLFFGGIKGARRNEMHARETWLAETKAAHAEDELKENAGVLLAFRTVASTMCEVVVILDQGLCITQSDQRVDAFFGKGVNGDHFPDKVAEEDRQRFHDALQAVAETQGIQSVPVALELHFATLKVQLIVVATHTQCSSYLVGLHSVEHSPIEEARCIAESVDPACPVGEEDDASSQYTQRRSLATTTRTGKVFADVLASSASMPARLQKQLAEIASIGEKEHWLVGTNDVELIPRKVFGSGGFGVVIGASLRGHPVVAKLPRHPAQFDSAKFIAALANELRIYRRLRHPNIVAFAGAVIDPGHSKIALLFEVVEGARLDVFVCKQLKAPRAEDRRLEKLKLMLDTGSALHYLHGLAPPVVHGDLKPANVLVEMRQQMPSAKLLDFGLSSLLTRNSRPAGGTRGWMAPEMQMLQKPSSSADVFAFGLLMRFIVTGERPTAAAEAQAPPPRARGGQAGDEVFQEFCELWTLCTQRDPEARPGVDNVHNALLNLLPEDDEVVHAFGRRLLMNLLEGMSWHAGLKELESNQQLRARAGGAGAEHAPTRTAL